MKGLNMKSFLSKFGTSIAFAAAGICYSLHALGIIDQESLNDLIAFIGLATGVVIGGAKIGNAPK